MDSCCGLLERWNMLTFFFCSCSVRCWKDHNINIWSGFNMFYFSSFHSTFDAYLSICSNSSKPFQTITITVNPKPLVLRFQWTPRLLPWCFLAMEMVRKVWFEQGRPKIFVDLCCSSRELHHHCSFHAGAGCSLLGFIVLSMECTRIYSRPRKDRKVTSPKTTVEFLRNCKISIFYIVWYLHKKFEIMALGMHFVENSEAILKIEKLEPAW